MNCLEQFMTTRLVCWPPRQRGEAQEKVEQ